MAEAMIRKKPGMASVKDMPVLQDGPPPDGFASVRFARPIPNTGPSAIAIFLTTFGAFSWGRYQVLDRVTRSEVFFIHIAFPPTVFTSNYADAASVVVVVVVYEEIVTITMQVLTRYLLQKLFGPRVANLTSNHSILYLDLPSNMIGSFLMGWFGVEFKKDISHVSEHLAIGIMTGYLGSLTTFSGWNQKMLELSASGHWVICALGFIIGLSLVVVSITFGVETAKGFRWLLNRLNIASLVNGISKVNYKVNSYHRQMTAMVIFLVILGILWGVSGAFVKAKFKHGGSAAE
ncbi:uncharacterized protein LOC131632783 [Vicia villosa]|uniref:uncharacterized protein LOC131632783 n=1 Tax=Vicia villosa TaxID=3911 RepID=UPI00273B660B|nr:uncharacterized protein LOC131632783 [Vicia villosa]